ARSDRGEDGRTADGGAEGEVPDPERAAPRGAAAAPALTSRSPRGAAGRLSLHEGFRLLSSADANHPRAHRLPRHHGRRIPAHRTDPRARAELHGARDLFRDVVRALLVQIEPRAPA